ncbi:hypothetical protein [Pseudomethylobacillus aquaticus]|uniref:hypothetical protein n=1 Tax=Pseudomethylobacillus aquaticus TaxID=2676064 RepID=UPI0012D78BA5|nr:hypothetical protein [Pseudomethylobacillus aquaticus]
MTTTKAVTPVATTLMECHSLEELVQHTCFCKLRESCPDKQAEECMRHRNIYAEFMRSA